MSRETMSHNPLVERDFAARKTLGNNYAAIFSIASEAVQATLPGMPLNRNEKFNLSHEDTKESYRKQYPNCTVVTSDEYEWDIAYRACMAGLTGGVYYGEDDDLKDVTNLAVEVVQNNIIEMTRERQIKSPNIYVGILTPSDLQDEVSKWYALGVSERTMGSVIEREAQERRDAFEEECDEYPLSSRGLEDYEFITTRALNTLMSTVDVLNDTSLYGPDDVKEVITLAIQQSGVNVAGLPSNIREYFEAYVTYLLTYFNDSDGDDWEED